MMQKLLVYFTKYNEIMKKCKITFQIKVTSDKSIDNIKNTKWNKNNFRKLKIMICCRSIDLKIIR